MEVHSNSINLNQNQLPSHHNKENNKLMEDMNKFNINQDDVKKK